MESDGGIDGTGVSLDTYLRLDVGITELPHFVRQIPLVRPQDCLIQREGSPITSRRHASDRVEKESKGEVQQNLVGKFCFLVNNLQMRGGRGGAVWVSRVTSTQHQAGT